MRHVLLGLVLAAGLQAQSLQGVVVDKLTGQPLAGAHVQLLAFPPAGAPVTDAAGRFHFDDLPTGASMGPMDTIRNGYLRASRWVTLKSGETVHSLRIEMTPQAVVAGRIEDEDGFPVQEAPVDLLRYQLVDGERKLQVRGYGQTNDLGEFRISGLNAGQYYLRVRPAAVPQTGVDFAPHYYPATTNLAEATLLEARPGHEVNGINMRVTRSGGYRVSGRLKVPPAARTTSGVGPNSWITLMLQSDDGMQSFVNLAASNSESGEVPFLLRHVGAGSYTLTVSAGAYAPQARAGGLRGQVRVKVEDGDVEGVNVNCHVVEPVDIPGKVVFTGGAAWRPMSIVLGGTNGGPMYIPTNDDGTFVLKGMLPDSYLVQAAPALRQAIQDVQTVAVRFAGEEVTGRLNFDGGTKGPLEITVAAMSAEFSARVVDAAGQPLEGAIVTLLGPTSQPGAAIGRQGGVIRLTAVPGEYLAAALAGAGDGWAVSDPEFLAAHEKEIRKVKLVPGPNPTVTLTAIDQ